jgi:hypothetical protein
MNSNSHSKCPTDQPEDAGARHGYRDGVSHFGHHDDDFLVALRIQLQQLLNHNDAFRHNGLYTISITEASRT